MNKLDFKMDDITEEKISDLVTFLDNPGTGVNPRMAMLYGRLKAKGEKIDKAEEWLDKDRKKKQESYKWKIINQIKQGIEEIRNENGGGYNPFKYEIVNIKSRTVGKTMQIGFRDIDTEGKTKWRKSILIEEKENPEFFKEMVNQYMPHEVEEEKPF